MLAEHLPDLSLLLADMAAAYEPAPETRRALPDIRQEQQLAAYLLETFGVRIPDVAVCEGHSTPWRAFCDCYFARHPVVVVKGSRGFAGKTFTLGLLALTEACVLGADVTLLGGSGQQSTRVHEAMAKFWASPNAPRHLLAGEPGVTKTAFARGNTVYALTASQRSVRGAHPQRLRIDECDEMDWRLFTASTGQTMKARGIETQTCIASTHQYPDGTMSAVLKMAADRGWAVHTFCWRETVQPHGWLEPGEVARKRGEMTDEMWTTEVELAEPSTENLAITPAAVEAMFDRALGETDGTVGQDERFEEPTAGGEYAHGADWGKRRDYSAVATLRLDTQPARFVAYYRDRRKPYHLMAQNLNARTDDYGGDAVHDRNGVGESVHEHLTGEVEGFMSWSGPERVRLFAHYITAIERGRVRAPRSVPWYRAHRYVTRDDLYGTGHPPDEFVACALAWRAAERTPLLLITGEESKRDVSEQARQEYEAAKRIAAERAVTDQVARRGVYWPGNGNGNGNGGLR